MQAKTGPVATMVATNCKFRRLRPSRRPGGSQTTGPTKVFPGLRRAWARGTTSCLGRSQLSFYFLVFFVVSNCLLPRPVVAGKSCVDWHQGQIH
jgi:hypothetical protein